MANLEADNIGEPVIIDDAILIPIGDTVFSGKLEVNVQESLFLVQSLFLKNLPEDQQVAWNLELIQKVESKFTPSGIFNELTEMENLTWIISQWIEAINERQKNK